MTSRKGRSFATRQLGTVPKCRQERNVPEGRHIGTVLANPTDRPANHRHLVRGTRRHVCGGAPWFGGAFWRDGASWREPLALSRDQMRAESLLCLELERGEPGFLDERA